MIDWTKPLQTKGGDPVTLLTSNGPGKFPHVGIVQDGTADGILVRWTDQGDGRGMLSVVNVPEKLYLNGPLQTRDGNYKARLLPNSTYYPYGSSEPAAFVVVLTSKNGDESLKAYKADGTAYYGSGSPYDLVNDVPTPVPPATKTIWLNVYENAASAVFGYKTKEQADRAGDGNRSRIKLTYTPGQMDT